MGGNMFIRVVKDDMHVTMAVPMQKGSKYAIVPHYRMGRFSSSHKTKLEAQRKAKKLIREKIGFTIINAQGEIVSLKELLYD